MAVGGTERRGYGRVEIDPPLRASLDGMPVSVVDASVTGMRIAHDARIIPVPIRRIKVQWEDRTMEFGVVVARSKLFRIAQAPGEKSVYHSGIHILEATGDSEKILREMITERVVRALDEMKANAHGIPPLADYSYQGDKGDRFRRCELTNGSWRKMETNIREQPPEGFTVSAEVDPHSVEMLCDLYRSTNDEGRRLTKILAQMSISKNEGGAVRRFVP